MREEQYKKLEENQREYLRELMMANSLSKNNEISGLHSEILKKVSLIEEGMKDVKEKIDSHDVVIKRVEKILPDIDKSVEAYKTTSVAGKLIIGVILGVPALAAFVTGIMYFVRIGEKWNEIYKNMDL